MGSFCFLNFGQKTDNSEAALRSVDTPSIRDLLPSIGGRSTVYWGQNTVY